MKKIITIAFIFTSLFMNAQTVETVSAFDPVFAISSAEANGKLFYYGTDYLITGLIVTDGTTAGTEHISLPDLELLGMSDLTAFNDNVYFVATGNEGTELWVTDGTIAGTNIVKDIRTSGSSYPSGLIVYDNFLYFAADDGINGEELWRTDGSYAGTTMLKDINPGPAASEVSYPIVYNNELYFSARDLNGQELWKTNGTDQGTVLVKDINLGGESSPFEFFVHQNKLYFSARTDDLGRELYSTNGTNQGTLLVSDINIGTFDSSPSDFYSVGNNLFFTAKSEAFGFELWKFNSVNNQVAFVHDFHPTNHSSAKVVGYIGNQLLVVAYTDLFEYRMFTVDLVNNNVNDFTNLNIESSYNYEITKPKMLGNRLYFCANDGLNGRELWSTDGTVLGTSKIVPVSNVNYNPLSLAEHFIYYNSALYFSADYSGTGNRLMKVSIPSTAGIDALDLGSFNVFPNPANEILTIELKEHQAIEIFDIVGNSVFKKDLEQGTQILNVSTFDAGTYFIRVSNSAKSTKIVIN